MSHANQKAMPTKAVAALNVASSSSTSSIEKSSKASSRGAVFAASGPSLMLLLMLAIIFICIGNFGLVEGLKCHMCGQYNEGVGSITPCTNYSEKIAHLYIKECTKKSEKFCVKYVSELSTVRDCATECVEKSIWETSTYCCTKDECNSGDHLKYSIVLLTLPILTIIWSKFDDFFKVRR